MDTEFTVWKVLADVYLPKSALSIPKDQPLHYTHEIP